MIPGTMGFVIQAEDITLYNVTALCEHTVSNVQHCLKKP